MCYAIVCYLTTAALAPNWSQKQYVATVIPGSYISQVSARTGLSCMYGCLKSQKGIQAISSPLKRTLETFTLLVGQSAKSVGVAIT